MKKTEQWSEQKGRTIESSGEQIRAVKKNERVSREEINEGEGSTTGLGVGKDDEKRAWEW